MIDLEHVEVEVRRGVRALQQNKRPVVAVAIAVVALVATFAILRPSHDQESSAIRAAGQPSTSATLPSVPPTTAASSVPPATEPPPPSVTEPSTTATTTVVCEDSFDPSCGPFEWISPPPDNQPISVTTEPATLHAVVGQEFNVQVVVVDDAPIQIAWPLWSDCATTGDQVCLGSPLQISRTSAPHVGPWHPPAPFQDGSTSVTTLTHVFQAPGGYTLQIETWSRTTSWTGGDGVYDGATDPYASTTTVTFTITVDG